MRCGGASAVTSSRAIPMRCSSACMANCGWPARRRLLGVAADQSPGSRRRDRCRARAAPRRRAAGRRWWRAASAVAGIEPVEPAAITGPACAASRSASASISRSRRAAGSILPRSARMRAMLARDLQELECAASSRRHGRYQGVERSNGTWRVVMSSIRRARSSASASARAGNGRSAGLAFAWARCCAAHCHHQRASSSRRSSAWQRLGQVERPVFAAAVSSKRARPRRRRQAARCAAGSPPRCRARRGKPRAPARAARRVGRIGVAVDKRQRVGGWENP